MARLRFADDPISRLAIWARRFAFFSLVATLLSIIVVRSGFLEIEPSLATFGGALVFAALAILLGLAAFVTIWKDGLNGIGHALLAIFIGLVLLAYPAYLGVKAYKLPSISDVTTDPIDPPRFEAIARVRPRNANPIIYAGLYAAEQQRRAYPDDRAADGQRSAQGRVRCRAVRSPTSGAGAWSTRAIRRRRAKAVSKRWRARRSWASATTS